MQDLCLIHEEEINNQNVIISRKEVNSLILSLEAAYYALILKEYYLPKKTSSIITSEQLLQVLFGKYFVPKAESILIGVLLKSVKKYEILSQLAQIQLENAKLWEIDSRHTPYKNWALNVLKTL